MPDEKQYEIVDVRSNVDRLSVDSVHSLFVEMLRRSIRAGEEVLRALVPKGKTERLMRNVSFTGPREEAGLISGAVGIPPIAEAEDRMAAIPSPDFFSPSGYTSRDYPLFRDRGTGIFGPAHAPISSHTGGVMAFDGADGSRVFARQVAGSPASHFMLATFEEMNRVTLPEEISRFRERVEHLYAEPNPVL